MTTTTSPTARVGRRRLALRFHPRMLNGHPGNVTPAVKKMIVRAVRAGLVVTSTTDGRHAKNSHHYVGQAVDLGLPGALVGTERGRRRMVGFQRREARNAGRFLELFGPDNAANVKNGAPYALAEGTALESNHDTHVHGAPRW
jgi:hypothetical protein